MTPFSLRNSIIGAGLLLAASVSLAGAQWFEFIDHSFSERAMGVLLGIVLIICGNFIPKTLEPLATQRCEPSRLQSLQRFAGWTFVLAGLGYAIVWLTFPIDRANGVAMAIVATGLVLVAGRTAWVAGRKRAQPNAGP